MVVGPPDPRGEKRDRDHEQRVWARTLRYDSHIGFLTEFENRFNHVIKFEAEGWPDRGAELPEDFLFPLYDRLTMLRTVGDQSTIDAAEGALSALRGYAYGPRKPPEVEKARDLYLVAMREEFGLDPIRPGGEIDTTAE